jgi:excisionase family DNA binding protein
MPSCDTLPMLLTPKQAAEIMGPTEDQIRGLIRSGKIAHVPVGRRVMIPLAAIERFIAENTVLLCRDEIQAPGSGSSKSEGPFTSCGRKEVAAGSAARALQIAQSLKSPLPNSSTPAAGAPGRVIPLRS